MDLLGGSGHDAVSRGVGASTVGGVLLIVQQPQHVSHLVGRVRCSCGSQLVQVLDAGTHDRQQGNFAHSTIYKLLHQCYSLLPLAIFGYPHDDDKSM